jgi:3-oxoacyl-[acyl-carrier protein] reductase
VNLVQPQPLTDRLGDGFASPDDNRLSQVHPAGCADKGRHQQRQALVAAGVDPEVGVIEQGGGRSVAVQADVSKVGDVRRLFDTCFERFGKLDILVNNAGVMFTKPVVEVGEEEFDRLFAVNVKGAFFCCKEAAQRMSDGGRIINLSSSTTALMLPGYAAYVATKGAVEQFSHVLAKELGPRGITVNVVSPGPTETELFNQGKSEEQKQRFAQMAALGRLGQPQDIADVVALLVSEDARWITGQNVRAIGGLI